MIDVNMGEVKQRLKNSEIKKNRTSRVTWVLSILKNLHLRNERVITTGE